MNWRETLIRQGVESYLLDGKHHACPGCGGTDRFRFDDKDGRGTWICSQGGGGIAYGDGWDLLKHVFNWDYRGARERIGMPADAPVRPVAAPRPPPKPPATLGYARAIWARVEDNRGDVAGHPYARAKRIDWNAGAARTTAAGSIIGDNADCIVVPVRRLEDFEVVGVECLSDRVDEHGKFLRQSFGQKAGAALPLGNRINARLPHHVCEGWATGVHLWRALGDVVVYVAFGKGMVRPTASWLEANRCASPVGMAGECDAL